MEFFFFFVIVWFIGYKLERRARRKKLRDKHLSAESNGVGRMLLESFGDGMYEVGVDIAPGTYRSPGRAPIETMWQRVSDFSGTEASLIACGIVRGPCIVTIEIADRGFESVNSGGWTRVGQKGIPEN